MRTSPRTASELIEQLAEDQDRLAEMLSDLLWLREFVACLEIAVRSRHCVLVRPSARAREMSRPIRPRFKRR
jgi:hypothetical protein